jgi:hypothetical protein
MDLCGQRDRIAGSRAAELSALRSLPVTRQPMLKTFGPGHGNLKNTKSWERTQSSNVNKGLGSFQMCKTNWFLGTNELFFEGKTNPK